MKVLLLVNMRVRGCQWAKTTSIRQPWITIMHVEVRNCLFWSLSQIVQLHGNRGEGFWRVSGGKRTPCAESAGVLHHTEVHSLRRTHSEEIISHMHSHEPAPTHTLTHEHKAHLSTILGLCKSWSHDEGLIISPCFCQTCIKHTHRTAESHIMNV